MTNDHPSLNTLVAEELRAMLARRRLSASELARMTGMTQRAVSRRLTGEKTIDVGDLEVIAQALEVDIADLLPARVSTRASHKAYSVPDSPDDELDSAEWTATPPREAHPVQPTSHKRSRRGTHSGRGGRRPAIQPWAHEGVTA